MQNITTELDKKAVDTEKHLMILNSNAFWESNTIYNYFTHLLNF